MEIEKSAVGIFSIILVLKKEICDAFCDAFLSRPLFSCELCRTCPSLTTTMNLTLIPNSLQTQMYHNLVALVQLIWQWTHSDQYSNMLIVWMISEHISREADMLFDGRVLKGEICVNFLIHWWHDLSIKVEAETPSTDKNKGVAGMGV